MYFPDASIIFNYVLFNMGSLSYQASDGWKYYLTAWSHSKIDYWKVIYLFLHEVTNITVRMTLNLQYTSMEDHFVSEGQVNMPTLQLGFITIATKKTRHLKQLQPKQLSFLTWLFFMLKPNQVILNELKLSHFNLSDSSLSYLSSKVCDQQCKEVWVSCMLHMFVCMYYIILFSHNLTHKAERFFFFFKGRIHLENHFLRCSYIVTVLVCHCWCQVRNCVYLCCSSTDKHFI